MAVLNLGNTVESTLVRVQQLVNSILTQITDAIDDTPDVVVPPTENDSPNSLRQLLLAAELTGQPLPLIRLEDGTNFSNVIVENVGQDVVEFRDPVTNGATFVPVDQIISVGSF